MALPDRVSSDVLAQLDRLIYDGFVADTSILWLPHLARFLQAVSIRLEQSIQDPATDQLRQQKIEPWWRRYLDCAKNNSGGFGKGYSDALENYRWMVEEYRVSVFAQRLGTSIRISPTRLERAWLQVDNHPGP